MVIRRSIQAHQRGFLNAELIVAMAILVAAILPLAFGSLHAQKLARIYYQDAIAMQILDGEMEVLAAGEWRAFSDGEHVIRPVGAAMTNLPPGEFVVVKGRGRIRVEWRPEKHGRRMGREVRLP